MLVSPGGGGAAVAEETQLGTAQSTHAGHFRIQPKPHATAARMAARRSDVQAQEGGESWPLCLCR